MHRQVSGRRPTRSVTGKFGGVETLPTGEEEVEVTESAAPVITGAWCKRETLRR